MLDLYLEFAEVYFGSKSPFFFFVYSPCLFLALIRILSNIIRENNVKQELYNTHFGLVFLK
mgnify:FL=1